MNIINAFILGIVEGITEFLPISSTAHLLISGRLLHLSQNEFQTFFDIFIQSGAILAVVFIYFSYIIKNKDLWGKILVSFIPTAIVGLILEKIIKKYFFNSLPLVIGSMFLIGLLFIFFEYFIKNKKNYLAKSIKDMNYTEAFLIGVGQSLAVVPGVSRSGIVMISMMGQKFKRDESAVYSFLLAVPTLLAASGFEIIKTNLKILTNPSNLVLLTVGFFASFATAYVAIRWFIRYMQKNSLVYFGLYRIFLSVSIFFIL